MYPQDDKNCKCSRHNNHIEDENISLKMCKTGSILSSVTIVLTGYVQANEAFIKLRFFFRYSVNILFQSDEQFCILGKWTKNTFKNFFDHLGLSVSCSWTIFSQGDLKTDKSFNNQTLRKDKTIYDDVSVWPSVTSIVTGSTQYWLFVFLFCIEIITGKFHHSIYMYYIHFHFTIGMQICLQINTQGIEDLFYAIATRV